MFFWRQMSFGVGNCILLRIRGGRGHPFDHFFFRGPNMYCISFGILLFFFASWLVVSPPPCGSSRFACTGRELFQNRAFRVDGKLCFIREQTGKDEDQTQPWHMADTRMTYPWQAPFQQVVKSIEFSSFFWRHMTFRSQL